MDESTTKLCRNETAVGSEVSSLESSSPSFDSLNGDLPSNGLRLPSANSLLNSRTSNVARQISPQLFRDHLESPAGLLSLAAHETMPPSCSPYSPFQSRPLTSSATVDDREK
jgi:hypothetical protein